MNGGNYIIPIDAQLKSNNDLDFEALPIELVLAAMERNAKVNLVFLDACRDNPLATTLARSLGTRSVVVGRGLAKLDTGVGSLIAFATQPGNVALDGAGRNSPLRRPCFNTSAHPGRA
ncbi:caspase domain-containing protein [Ensifer adhaerens]|nr:caspase family protein [Ensifer adhaerens]RAS05227.1 caspase domain-containing protein [Ensifer adhaerens]